MWSGSGFFISYSLTQFIHRRGMNLAARGWNLRPPYCTNTHTHTWSYIQCSVVNISHSYLENKERPYMAKLCVCVCVPQQFYIHSSKQAMTKRARMCKHTDAQNRTFCVHPQKMCSSLEALAKHSAVKLIVLKTSVHFLLCKKPIPSNPLKHILTLNNFLKPFWSISTPMCKHANLHEEVS